MICPIFTILSWFESLFLIKITLKLIMTVQHNIMDELSPKQREVWDNVKNYTELIMKNDVTNFLVYFHKDYSSWNYHELIPINKNDIKNELENFPQRKISSYNIIPVSINIFNDVAIVHYFYTANYKNTDGQEKEKKRRNTDILLKQKDKWVLIGDFIGGYRE